jgi:type VI secretion system protein ImpH
VVLGERVRDRSGKFRIHITELDWQRFHEFLPIGFGYQPLCALVRFTCVTRSITTFAWCCARKKSANCALASKTPVAWDGPVGWPRKADGVVTLGSKIH